jgi:glycosyltransferase involved in cell wall biosynthesis
MHITIVTPSFNQRVFLEQTISSVLGQRGDFTLDHLVVDGQSTDGTVDLLRSITDPRLHWSSQPDTGQSDALNRGFRQATGEIVGWLNSDDLYTPGTLSAVADAFTNPHVNWVVGGYQIIDTHNRITRPMIVRYKNLFLKKYSYRKLLRENFIAQPSVLWRRSFGEKIGPLDQSLHHAMDYDLWLRMGRAADPVILHRVLSQFRIHPQSKSGRLNRERFDEDYRVALRYIAADQASRWIHKLNNEKIVWAYRAMSVFGK